MYSVSHIRLRNSLVNSLILEKKEIIIRTSYIHKTAKKNKKLINRSINYVLSMSKNKIPSKKRCYKRILELPELPYRQYYLL